MKKKNHCNRISSVTFSCHSNREKCIWMQVGLLICCAYLYLKHFICIQMIIRLAVEHTFFRGVPMAQLVCHWTDLLCKAIWCHPEGRGFESHLNQLKNGPWWFQEKLQSCLCPCIIQSIKMYIRQRLVVVIALTSYFRLSLIVYLSPCDH